ncbi:helix-turn-helix domain-containing protein [Clostridium intestinale]|uniref:helix-turn-helix domain-containing protein n=1 Tax=Clostridium intestinale TaxID=36845 RepID=UPI002DD67DAF|nr:helix-turn-helix domain-containing protein [Clostridium intestinale]WRY53152.1 helix-turn-helix domain-containing protein [Clostridium intestinale]
MDNELIKLLKLAQGDRTLNAFARHSDVSAGNLSRIMNGQKPTPEVLKKLSLKAHNGIRYEDLMMAAGYIEDNEILSIKEKDDGEYTIALHNSDGYDADLPPEAIKELKEYIEFLKHKYGKSN